MSGTYLAYRPANFRGDKAELIGLIAQISDTYEQRGYIMSVRQVYYELVSNFGLANQAGSYDRVQAAVNDGRLAGLVSWTAFEDRGRSLRGLRTYSSPQELLREAREKFRRDLWETQPMRPEIWIEKEALIGVIQKICNRLRVDFYATKGYNSQSEQWAAGQRFSDRMRRGQRPVVIHLGDHDPSGIDMTRDNHERLSMFAGFPVPVERIALNMHQIEEHQLPENPDNRPKRGDARTAGYVEKYGDMGWELDALGPDRIERMIEDAVLRIRDENLWSAALAEEVEETRELDELMAMMGGDDDPEDDE